MLSAPAVAQNFLAANKDLLALVVSLAALAFSMLSARQNLATTRKIADTAAEDARALARAAAYQRIHELLVDPKAASGRRQLFQAARANAYPKLGEPGWDEINYSLALYDTLAGYVAHSYVDQAVVLDAWHHPLTNIAPAVRGFMAHRRGENVSQPWAYLMSLLALGEKHTCTCPKVADHETSPVTAS